MELVLDHYENPRNYGDMENADVTKQGGNPGCGDIIKIYLTVDRYGVADQIKFSGEGCMISQAGASLMVEKMKGKSIVDIQTMSPDAVKDVLGKKLVSTRPQCAMLGFNTVKNAITEYKRRGMLSSIERAD